MSSFEKQVLSKLDTLIRLIGINMLKDYKLNKDKITFLHSIGYTPSEIHKITGIPKQTIYNTTSKLNKEKEDESV